MTTNEIKIAKLANHRNFYNATLYVKCEEKNGSRYWYGYNDSDLVTKTISRCKRGTGRITKTYGNPWKRISKKAAVEILAKYEITAEQFIAYTDEEPELMSELNEQKAEEESKEMLDFFLSTPLTKVEALQVVVDAEIELAVKNSEIIINENDVTDNNDCKDVYAGRELDCEVYMIEIPENAGNDETEIGVIETTTESTKAIAKQTDTVLEADDCMVYEGRELIIEMYGNKKPMFTVNGKNYFGGKSWSRKQIDELILEAYNNRTKYGNVQIIVPRVVAAMDFVKVFNDNPNLDRELNVIYTEWNDRTGTFERQLKEYEKYCHKTPDLTSLVFKTKSKKNRKQNKASLPSGDYTVESGAEAFALVSSYFPDGLIFDGIDYGYRGETHFCFYNENLGMSVIAASDETDRRIETVQVINNRENGTTLARHYPLNIDIKPKTSAGETLAELTSKAEMNNKIEKDKYRVESIGQADNELGWILRIEFSNDPKVAMAKSWDIHTFYKHFGIVTDSETGEVQYTFGQKDYFDSISETLPEKTIDLKEKAEPFAENPVVSKNVKKKETAKAKVERWLENVKADDAGRYYIVPELTYANFEKNSSWNPCFYILTNDWKLRRIGLKFAIELAKAGKSVEISKDKISTLDK